MDDLVLKFQFVDRGGRSVFAMLTSDEQLVGQMRFGPDDEQAEIDWADFEEDEGGD